MVAHLTVRLRPSLSPTISTSVCSSSPRSRNVAMPPNALVCYLYCQRDTDPITDMQSSQPEFARSPGIPHSIHLYDLDAMPVPGSSPALHTGWHHCRLLLPWSNRNGACRYRRVHLGKQCVTTATTYCCRLGTDDLNSFPVRRLHHLRHPLGLPSIQPRPHASDHIGIQR